MINEVPSLRISKDINFLGIEELAQRLHEVENAKLQIPNKLSYSGGFGMEGAALQYVATWLRQSQSHVIHTSIQELRDKSFESLCNSLFGLCTLRLSDSILLANKTTVDMPTALRAAIPILHDIRSENFSAAFKGMYLALPAIKSPIVEGGKDREFDTPLYNGNHVVGQRRFRQLTAKALSAMAPDASKLDEETISHLSEILRELFNNTHKHARTDADGNPQNKNFRGIIFNSISLSASRLDEISKSGGANLTLFLGDWRPEGKRLFRALDVTVVDSGPGYARRWTGKNQEQIAIEEERSAITECFKKHRSTSATDSSGSGLSNVLADLKALRGWFRLRTGRTLVEKSFFNHSGASTIEFSDVKEQQEFLEGVVFNVVIPFKSL